MSPLYDTIQKDQPKEIEVPVTAAKSHYKSRENHEINILACWLCSAKNQILSEGFHPSRSSLLLIRLQTGSGRLSAHFRTA